MIFCFISAMEKKFMRAAFREAQKNIKKIEGGPFGAVIVKDGKAIAKAHNTIYKHNDPTAHAEVNAIRKACKKLKTQTLEGCEIYSSCEPCPMCFSAIHWARINKVIFSSRIEDAIEAGFNEIRISDEKLKELGHLQIEIIPNLLKEEGKKIFEIWKKEINKQY